MTVLIDAVYLPLTIKHYPQTIKACKEFIAGYESDAALALKYKIDDKDKFSPMALGEVTYTDKADAGKMLIAICQDNTSSQPTQIGSYRGFKMEVFYDTFSKEYCLELCGRGKHQITLGTDSFGNLTRIENELSKIPVKLKAAKVKLDETYTQLENAKQEVKKPFSFENELKEKSERLNYLNIKLNLDKKDNSLDTEPENNNDVPVKKAVSRVR